ncbi:hypothetical protein [Pusillimonas minor]|uniref:Uncharacterized protein n=1 Tax=Pusillimonas minor TaxID=2697024 RepID=A0A842HTX2_9BURK|nr:hypothetical protein [Pusillimonas minor]MBC2771062.1 hypothetical protein [Pusillimonas minor]
MLWLKGVKVLFVIVGALFVGVCVALAYDEFGWAVVFGMFVAVLAVIGRHRIQQLCAHDEPYKNVTFYCLRESPTVWSTHIGGRPQRLAEQSWRRLKSVFSRRRGSIEGMKLVLAQEARLEVRRRSLACFTRKLDQLVHVENAVLITASVLNDSARGDRLQQRIHEIEKRPEWRYQLIERKLGAFEAIVGRAFYSWQFSKEDCFWRPYVPGLVAWRAQDQKPCLKALSAR